MVKLKKRNAVVAFILFAIVGSFFTFYSTNLLLSDLANMYYSAVTIDLVASLPFFFFSLELIVGTIAPLRMYARPIYFKAEVITYCGISAVFAVLGIACGFVSGLCVYHSFVKPYPFPYATIVIIAMHALVLVLTLAIRHRVAKTMPEDKAKRKLSVHYVLFTIMLSFVIYFAFDRLGALLWMPVYAQVSSLSRTWTYYLAMLLPAAILGHMVLYYFDVFTGKDNRGLIYAITILVLNALLCAQVLFYGLNDTQFVSAISPCVGLERLATTPYATIVHFPLVALLGIYCVWHSIKKK